MANPSGSHIWYELLTTDLDAAGQFYPKILPWTVEKFDTPGMDYRMIIAPEGRPEGGVGGMMTIPEGAPQQPVWLGYIGVEDVDSTVEKIKAKGGSVQMEPKDIPDVGRFAMVSDPQGVPFYVMRGNSPESSKAFAYDKPRPGHTAWNELATTDKEAAMAFYSDLFGWKKDGDMDMGPMGTYDFLRDGEGMLGAMMSKPDEMPVPMWTYYFRVEDLDAARQAIEANGGKVVNGPMEIPGGDHMLNAQDPQGGYFSLVGKSKAGSGEAQ